MLTGAVILRASTRKRPIRGQANDHGLPVRWRRIPDPPAALARVVVPIVDWVFAAVAITFGAVGISTAGRRGGAGKGMAVAGLVLGLVTAGLGLIFWAV